MTVTVGLPTCWRVNPLLNHNVQTYQTYTNKSGRKDRRMDRRREGRRTDGSIDRPIDGWRWTEGRRDRGIMDAWMDRRMGGWTEGSMIANKNFQMAILWLNKLILESCSTFIGNDKGLSCFWNLSVNNWTTNSWGSGGPKVQHLNALDLNIPLTSLTLKNFTSLWRSQYSVDNSGLNFLVSSSSTSLSDELDAKLSSLEYQWTLFPDPSRCEVVLLIRFLQEQKKKNRELRDRKYGTVELHWDGKETFYRPVVAK